jgi:hypothetical protein
MGLYDDDNKAITSGDVLDVIYWQTKFAANKLDAALATRQPEYPIRLLTAEVINGATDVLKTYPNHEEVKAWQEKAQMIQGKVDPNAPSADWKTNFAHWRDYAYEAGWRHFHIAKMAAQDEDWAQVRSHASEAVRQLGYAVDRMGEWPDDVKQWIISAKEETEAVYEKAKSKK